MNNQAELIYVLIQERQTGSWHNIPKIMVVCLEFIITVEISVASSRAKSSLSHFLVLWTDKLLQRQFITCLSSYTGAVQV